MKTNEEMMQLIENRIGKRVAVSYMMDRYRQERCYGILTKVMDDVIYVESEREVHLISILKMKVLSLSKTDHGLNDTDSAG